MTVTWLQPWMSGVVAAALFGGLVGGMWWAYRHPKEKYE